MMPGNKAAHDPGLQLIAGGRMPGADALTSSGLPCWTWESIAHAFGADPDVLANLLPRRADLMGRDPIAYTFHP